MSDKRFNPKHLHKLDSLEREKLLPKNDILNGLDIVSADTILDLGSGTGYFTIPLANMTTGTVYGLDVADEMLTFLKERFMQAEITNIELVKGKIEQVPMEDECVDKLIASMVLHEIDPLEDGLNEMYRLLRKGGRGLIVEWAKKESITEGPPNHHRLDKNTLIDNIKKSGFHHVDVTFSSDDIYVVSFDK